VPANGEVDAVGAASQPQVRDGAQVRPPPTDDQAGVGEVIVGIGPRKRRGDDPALGRVQKRRHNPVRIGLDGAFRHPHQQEHFVAITGDGGIEDADDLEVVARRGYVFRSKDRVLCRTKDRHDAALPDILDTMIRPWIVAPPAAAGKWPGPSEAAQDQKTVEFRPTHVRMG
jgi:hypothetical protein